MGGIVVIAETRQGQLRAVTLELITAALELKTKTADRLAVVVIDNEPGAVVGELSVEGVDEILAISSPNQHFEPHTTQAALSQLVASEQPSLLLAAHSVDSLGFAPALAARESLGFVSDVTAIEWSDEWIVRRGAYGDKLVAGHEFPADRPALVLLRPGAFAPASPTGSGSALREVGLELALTTRSEHLGFIEPETGEVDITKADFLVSVGRGIEDADDLPRFERLAKALGATLSASRPLVDAGWIPSARQVGQSGNTVKPRVYLALGISGAVQHLAGIRGAETIIAINTDPSAPIFAIADFGAVVDMFELADELARLFE